MKLHPHWKRILRHSYTAWLGYLLVLINAFDASYYYFLGYLPIAPWVIGLISAAIGALIPYARVILQKKLSGASINANS